MAKVWQKKHSDKITFEQFIYALDNYGEALFHESNQESVAHLLSRLAHNRDFLPQLLHAQISGELKAEQSNAYTPQVFILHVSEYYMVRAPIWVAPAAKPGEEIFIYGMAHDHNFNFFTVGYFGPGYKTQLWEYEYDSVIGYEGEQVEMVRKEDLTLSEGKVMLYERNKDIHAQLSPQNLSISINIIHKEAMGDQYSFDTENQSIRKKIDGNPFSLLFQLAESQGDDDMVNQLRQIYEAYPNNHRTRLDAFLNLSSRDGDELIEKARADESPLIRHYAEKLKGQMDALKAAS